MVPLFALRAVLIPAFVIGCAFRAEADVRVVSPDGRLVATVSIGQGGVPTYAVTRDAKPLVATSKLGLITDGSAYAPLEITGSQTDSRDETWRPVCGERSEVRDHCNEVAVTLKESAPHGRSLEVFFRVYDEGVAFRYGIPKDGRAAVTVTRELTEFRFVSDWFCHVTSTAQGIYSRVPFSKLGKAAERPLLVEAGGPFVALGEAGLTDFARLRFVAAEGGNPGVVAHLDGPASGTLPLLTPWRVIMTADSPGELLANDFIFPNLNPPCAIADTSWIKPGTVMREMTLTTVGAKQTVDFCAAHRIGYLLFDAGWYGDEWSPKSDASRVNVDPRRSKGPLDLKEVIRHAVDKGIGVILYVNGIAMAKQLDEILPLYRSWGVKGVKYGFVPVGNQRDTAFISRAIRLAAENRLMVDIHDEWRPTGTSRTWPNLMTCEGIRGDEEKDRTNAQSLTHLFTRFLCGPADNTYCYYDARVDRLCDHAYQLAKTVCYFSPWQTILWYDRPATTGASLKPGDNLVGDEPELGFFDRMPARWDETRVIAGETGRFAVIARRSGTNWRVGVMNAETPRTLEMKTDFLKPDRSYEAVTYTQDPSVPTRTHVRIMKSRIDASSVIRLRIDANSGAALEISPVGE